MEHPPVDAVDLPQLIGVSHRHDRNPRTKPARDEKIDCEGDHQMDRNPQPK